MNQKVRTHQFDHLAFFVVITRLKPKIGGICPFELFGHVLPICPFGAVGEPIAQRATLKKEVGFPVFEGRFVDGSVDQQIRQPRHALVQECKVAFEMGSSFISLPGFKRDMVFKQIPYVPQVPFIEGERLELLLDPFDDCLFADRHAAAAAVMAAIIDVALLTLASQRSIALRAFEQPPK